jgi:1-acyl-sn-glycerol-3-phosphate acyltransferase
VRLLRIAGRGAGLIAHLLLGAAALAVLRRGAGAWTLRGRRLDERFTPWWYARACRVLGLRVTTVGGPTPLPALFAANHVSWLEVLALGSVAPLSFVAKSEVARWPLIGPLARAAGTLFVRRGAARPAAAAVDAAVGRLAEGGGVCVFPEGTSTAGDGVLPFRAAFFEAPVRLGCEVQPVAVRYPRAGAVAPFVGDDEFVPHLLRVLAEPEVAVELVFTPPLSAHGRERGALAERARTQILQALAARRRDDAVAPPRPASARRIEGELRAA